jgi:type IV pilus assembly protein PilC
MAVAVASRKPGQDIQQTNFYWEGKDRSGRLLKGEMRASGDAVVTATLRRQGIQVVKVRKQNRRSLGKVTEKDISLFTRQLATMLRAGVPLLQAFEIVSKGSSNAAVSRLLNDVKTDVETGSSLQTAFSRRPQYFDALYCNLVGAGEAAGILDTLLDRLATYKEKLLALKSKIRGALFYPVAVIAVAILITAVIMIFVVPQFKDLFSSFGAELPFPTRVVIMLSDFFVHYWWILFLSFGLGFWGFMTAWRRSPQMQMVMDRGMLKIPVFGPLLHKAATARWARTLSTMFAAGVPMVDALDSVAGAAGNHVFYQATKRIQADVNTGTALTLAMQSTGIFPNMLLQMASIGEESGSLDSMLTKVADFYEEEVDDAVAAISSLIEPAIMVILGGLIGGLVIAMYMPIFKMGSVV